MPKHNIIYIDGPNSSGKTYSINELQKCLISDNLHSRIKYISIKNFYTDIDPFLKEKIYSYNIQAFTHAEVMYILNKHKEMIEYINYILEKNVCDIVLVDRGIISFLVYNICVNRLAYTCNDVSIQDEYSHDIVDSFIHKQIVPLLKKQNSLYVYLRFSLLRGQAYLDDAFVKSIDRLYKRGVEAFNLDKIRYINTLMETMHYRLYGLEEHPRYFEVSASSVVHTYFSDVIATDSENLSTVITTYFSDVKV